MPFLNENCYLMFSSFISIIAPIVLRKGISRIIGHVDSGGISFTSGFSQEHRYFTVGERITVEQLTELSIVMRISRYDHVYRHHVRDK